MTVNVPRELLERACALWPDDMSDDGTGRIGWLPHVRTTVAELRALLSAPSPAGVDGLEVVGWVNDIGRFILGKNGYEAGCNEPFVEEDLCRLSAAQAIIDGLRLQQELASIKQQVIDGLRENQADAALSAGKENQDEHN